MHKLKCYQKNAPLIIKRHILSPPVHAQIEAKEADVEAISKLTHALEKKVSSALCQLRQHNSYNGNLSFPWTRPTTNIGDSGAYLSSFNCFDGSEESRTHVNDIIESSRLKAYTMVNSAIQNCTERQLPPADVAQVDFNLPQRFDITYVDSDSVKKRPIMIHRAVLGSLERFFGVLIEHYAGDFPLWLSPIEARSLPVTDMQLPRESRSLRLLAEDSMSCTSVSKTRNASSRSALFPMYLQRFVGQCMRSPFRQMTSLNFLVRVPLSYKLASISPGKF